MRELSNEARLRERQDKAVNNISCLTTPSSKLALCHPLTAAVPFVALRHFPAPRGITPDKWRLLVSAVFKAPSDEGGGFLPLGKKTEGEIK